MTKILTPGVVTGLLSAAAVAASLAGRPALAAFFQDPGTAANVLALLGAAGALAAGFLKGARTG
ncbi:hypothetical protein M446_5980 [Methylobacterium sp. 4-46]|uniref:hypothetical protein n=1 Tax=unclassified Methylobacterium TaxID=2615210 RepID=UPI000165CBA8|nr:MULTISPECIES: hypothetical protein [Methylobacterium]ACA20257.1 hypothetical protein M446_5980 [Methylobacterium sp. 4-46]WFT79435.1 hypothetical protein QA634_30185 [Methylobacterium nodulans]